MACPPTPSTQSLMIHHYILVCASLNSSSSLEVQTFPSLVHHSAGPLYLPAATAVDFNVLESTRDEYTDSAVQWSLPVITVTMA